jgi:glucosamine kinase
MGTESLVLGGTSTRILVVGTDGRVRGLSTAGGGNPISHPAGAAAALAGALRAALAGIDPHRVNASVVGVADHRLTRTADGHGWLLGDDGSGFWLGREAVRATLRALDAGEPPGHLAGSVLRELAGAGTVEELAPSPSRRGTERCRDRLIEAVNSRPGVQLSALARWSARPTGRATRRRGRSSSGPRPRSSPRSAGSGGRPRPPRSSSPEG